MIIFLDFDGVLHGLGRPVFECLPRFEAILRDFPAVEVVITSSWRETYPLDALRELFGADIRHQIIGITPIIKTKWPPYPAHGRYDEIALFLQERQAQGRACLILDDDARLFPKDCRELVLFDSTKGLDMAMDGVLRESLKQPFPQSESSA